jgi:DNA primase
MASYSPAILDDIRAGVDVVDLVGRLVNLRKAGQNYKGLCPFHAEKTPSFMVNPKKGIFHCFGCGVGGDVFGFLMRQDRLSFPEAVRVLAKQANVALPEDRGASAAGDSGREELYRVMDAAAAFYVERLWASGGERAREYLDKRGIDPEVARRFGLGWAPEGWETIRAALTGFGEDALIAAGLLVTRENKPGTYDRFRGRLLFAIRDLQGRVVAFGGRGFGDEQPKYLNSPETPLYSKGNLLYAADLARESIREKNRALIVEGYVDCLMAHQYGFTETVAALGTAFTAAQLGVLRRYCDEVITFFDADAAGQKAAERAEELLEPSGGGLAWGLNRAGAFEGAGSLRVKVALLPAGHDPDTFLREHGTEGFTERIAGSRSLLGYALDRTIGEAGSTPRARVNAFARVALMLAKVTDAQEAAALSREAALKLGVDATQLWIEAQRLQVSLRRPATVAGTATTTPAPPIFERDLVALLLASRDARGALLPLLDPAEIVHAGMREIVETIARVPDGEAPALMSELGTDAGRHALSALIVDERPLSEETVVIQQFRRRLERTRLSGRLRSVSQGVAEVQQKAASSAVPMDATIVAELQQQGAVLHELVGGSVPSLTPAVESSPDPAGPQGVHTHE